MIMIKLTADNFEARLAQAKFATNADIANFVKETYFDDKLKKYLLKRYSNQTKHVLVENELDEISGKVGLISMKGLTKDSINRYRILNGAKNFSSAVLQNYLVFLSANKDIK